jgi:serine/threonine protein kinase
VADREEWIEHLAGAILDGVSIDWAAAESNAEFAGHPLLSQFRLLATVADFHRRPPSPKQHGGESDADKSLYLENGPPLLDSKYLIEGSVGQGGMGLVYRVRHIELGKLFAVKLLQPHKSYRPEYLARFRIEAQSLGLLNHPNIVQVTDFGVDPRAGPYLVMEYIEGVTLREHIRDRGTLPFHEALPILGSISRALDYAHDSGILHRDLKPANVLLFTNSAGHRDAKIVDFGIAFFLDHTSIPECVSESVDSNSLSLPPGGAPGSGSQRDSTYSETESLGLTAPGTILGTLEYIAPEVIAGGKASSSGDIYAFGVLIYEVLAGRRPFGASIQEPPSSHVQREPPLPSSVCSLLPRELDQAILRPLNKDPSSRPIRARHVVTELRDAYRQASVRQWRRSEFPKRAGLSAVITIVVLLLYAPVQKLPIIQTLENTLLDFRVALYPTRSPDPRIVLISIDEATLSLDSGPLVDKADEVGTLLRRAFDAGARTVAIDLLLPEQWSRSESFSQLILDHSTKMVLASYSGSEGDVSGPEAVKGLVTAALGREKIETLFAFVNVQADPDGVVRTMPLVYRDQHGKSAYSLAARAARVLMGRSPAQTLSGAPLRIDYSIDWTKFPRLSWKDLPEVLARQPEVFHDRVILIGGEFVGSGDVYNTSPYVTGRPKQVSGLVLHALTLNTLLEGTQIRTSDETVVLGFLCAALAMAATAVLCFSRNGRTMSMLAVSGLLYTVFSFLLFGWNRELSPIVAPAAALCLAILAAALLRQRLPPHPLDVARLEKVI